MDPYQYQVEINPNVTFAITTYAEHSILKLIGFKSQSTVIDTFQMRAVEYMVFGANMNVHANVPPLI